MHLLHLIAIFLFLSAAPVLAQDVFVRQHPSAQPKQESAPQPEAQAVAPAQDTMQSFSARYFTNCMAKKDQILSGENQKKLCACSAEKLGQNMTIENLQAMSQPTADGEIQRKRLLLEVYAPCLEYPAKALLYENCVTGEEVKTKLPNYQAVCGCMSENMGKYIASNGSASIEESLRADPTNTNPLASLMNSPNFQAQAQAELVKCIPAMTGK